MRGDICGCVVSAKTLLPVAQVLVMGTRTTSIGDADTVQDSADVSSVAAQTDSSGRFALEGLEAGTWMIEVSSGSDSGDFGVRGTATVHVFENAISEVTVEVFATPRGSARESIIGRRGNEFGSVHGTVVRAGDEQPVADAAVTVVSGAGRAPDVAALSEASGTFALDGLAPGNWLLRALGPRGEQGETPVQVKRASVTQTIIYVYMENTDPMPPAAD